MEVTLYNTKGDKDGTLTLPEAIFDMPLNTRLIHQVVVSLQSNARPSVAHAKDRSEVRGGGRKPWRQKGTGNARHGSTRSPIWIGGGATFGPRNEKDYTKKINKKMKSKALFSALSEKMRRGDTLFMKKLTFGAPKTKEAKDVLVAFSRVFEDNTLPRRKNAFLVILPEHSEVIKKSFANIGTADIVEARNLNALDILTHKKIIFCDAENAVAVLEERAPLSKKESKKELTS